MIGAGCAVVLSVVLLLTGGDEPDNETDWDLLSEGAEAVMAVGLLVGFSAVGALIGTMVRSESWQPVHLSALGVGVSMGGGDRKALVLRIRF